MAMPLQVAGEVAGWDLLREVIWPEVLEAFDCALAATTTNASNFHSNFLLAKMFINDLGGHAYMEDLMQRFNLPTYFNLL